VVFVGIRHTDLDNSSEQTVI